MKLYVRLFGSTDPCARQVPVQRGPIVGHGDIPRVGVVGIVTGDGLQGEGAVFHRAREGTDGVHGPHAGPEAMPADAAPGGPEPHHLAPGGGPTHGPSRILPQGGGTQAGGGGPAGTTAGTAGEAL